MSELIGMRDDRTTIRWKLLTGASALALSAYFSSVGMARADSDHPPVWFEVDDQFTLLSSNEEPFLPPFALASPFDGAIKVTHKRPPSEWDEGAKISFNPSGSDWMMSLGIRYGRSSRREIQYQETTHVHGNYHGIYSGYQDSVGSSSEKHLILDFKAGRDVGLGRIGQHGTSIVSAGVRYAQFDSHSDMNIKSITAAVPQSYYIFHGSFEAKRSFRGIGPSLSWDASANLAGDPTAGSLTFDWDVNGALLFGRQRVKGHHEKTELYQRGYAYFGPPKTTVYQTSRPLSRSKNVAVPNLGGFAALSLRYSNAKISLGYRADMFFGVIDGGIDATKKDTRGFLGPFASVSFGLGD